MIALPRPRGRQTTPSSSATIQSPLRTGRRAGPTAAMSIWRPTEPPTVWLASRTATPVPDGKFTVGDGGDVTHTAVQDHPGHTAGSGRHGQDLVDVAVLGLAGHVDHERRSEGSLGHAHVQGEVVPGGATHGVGGRGEGRSRPEGEQMCPE